VTIIEDGGDGVTMELEMQWDGNPSIILDIKTLVGVALPVQVVFSNFLLPLQVWFLLFPSSWLDDFKCSIFSIMSFIFTQTDYCKALILLKHLIEVIIHQIECNLRVIGFYVLY
jgi:hypothetical protein